jgi:hypothetical protein
MEAYRESLKRLRQNHLKQVRYTFYTNQWNIYNELAAPPHKLILLNPDQWDDQKKLNIYGTVNDEQEYLPERGSNPNFQNWVTLVDSNAPYYLIFNRDIARNRSLNTEPSEPLLNYFAKSYHDVPDSDCRGVNICQETCRTLFPDIHVNGAFQTLVKCFPEVPKGYVSKTSENSKLNKPSVRTADFVSFCLKTNDPGNTLTVLAVLAANVAFEQDTLLLKVIYSQDELRPIQKLLQSLINQPDAHHPLYQPL